jgi:hypothetical protein
MSVYYYNGSQILAPLQITSNEPVYSTDSISLKQLRASQGAQRWELSFNVLTNDNAADLLLGAIDEIDSVGSMVMPQLKEVSDKNTLVVDTSSVAVSAAGGSSSVTVSRTGNSGLLPRGSFVKFSNHDKVYIVKQDVDFFGIGNTAISIYPALTSALTAGHSIVMGDSVDFTYYRSVDDITGITYMDGILADPGRITLIEAL